MIPLSLIHLYIYYSITSFSIPYFDLLKNVTLLFLVMFSKPLSHSLLLLRFSVLVLTRAETFGLIIVFFFTGINIVN